MYKLLIVAMVAGLSVRSSAPAAGVTLINLNFASNHGNVTAPGEDAGVLKPSPDYYNNVPFSTLSVLNLVDSNNVATTADLTISGDVNDGSAINNTASGGDRDLMDGHIYSDNDATITISITNLSADPKDVYVYFHSGHGAFEQTFTLNGGTPVSVTDAVNFNGTYIASDGAGSAGNYYLFSNVTGTTVNIVAQGTGQPGPGDNQYGYFNGLQILASPVPEPATLTLLGLGIIGLAIRLRRRRFTA